jgi:signal transduction histidine kinase
MQAYAKLAKLPPPNKQPVELAALIHRIASLETRVKVEVVEGPEVIPQVDGAQIEQLLLNLVKNAAEASPESGSGSRSGLAAASGVRIGWRKQPGSLEIFIEDDGPGIANPQNLFVPFFTTKPSGSGIGLVLCRQIAENHGGALTLENREGATGCIARLRLPL